MPPETLPEKAKEIFLKAEAAARETCPADDEGCIQAKAWSAVKRAYVKDGDNWVPKTTAELSFYITKAYVDNDDLSMRWKAVNSDIDPDSYNDEMSLELYNDFLARVKSNELPPEHHRSDFWSGGMPYLSIAHYLDLNGEGVPGDVEKLYIDGKQLKSCGLFYDTPLGRAAYKSVRENFSDEVKSERSEVRISIAFVDWGHIHKSNGYEFIRESLDDICLECLLEAIQGKGEGKIFKKGHLIHLALTRVPVNKRTSMEVERSMTTQLEDAASIIGKENVEKLLQKAEELKSEATDLVVKAKDVTEDDDSEKKDKKKDKEEKSEAAEKSKEDLDKADEKKRERSLDLAADEKHLPGESTEATPAFGFFLSAVDEISKSDVSYQDKLKAIQPYFDRLGEEVRSMFAPTKEEVQATQIDELKSMISQLSQNIEGLSTELAILKQQSLVPQKQEISQPIQRSITAAELDTIINDPAQSQGNPNSLRALARKSVGLSH